MEFMLPRVFDWPEIFHETECFPKLTAWHAKCRENAAFEEVRDEIWNFWVEREKDGQFKSIIDVVKDESIYKWKYP